MDGANASLFENNSFYIFVTSNKLSAPLIVEAMQIYPQLQVYKVDKSKTNTVHTEVLQ